MTAFQAVIANNGPLPGQWTSTEELNDLADSHRRGADFKVTNHGSVLVLYPLTKVGKEWLASAVADGALRWGRGLAVEPRYISDIVDGIINDGLEITGNIL